jgi:glycosyltransferase involved in cell wall biosynthesis
MLLRQRRSDVMHAFPDPLEADRPGFALWYVTSGRQEYGLPSRLVRPVLRCLPWRSRLWATLWWGKRRWERKQRKAAGAAAAPAAPSRSQAGPGEESATTLAGVRGGGVNVVGWVDAPTGVGAACRGTLAALEEAGIPHGVLRFPHAPGAGALLEGEGELPFEVTLFHVNADMMETVVGRLPLAATAGRRRIGLWFWELQHFPLAFASSFRHVDEVWAPSRFCEGAFAGISPVAVRWVPPCVPPPAPSPLGRATWGVPGGVFLFFSAFDALSVPERKNPEALLAAVAKLREAGLPAHLLLKVSHAAMAPGLLERLEVSSRDLPVTLLAHEAPKQEMDAMMAACDAYVSLHRSEGLGLPLIEAMYLGKPVVATGYGGCLDFLDKATGWPVRYRLVALDTAVGPYPAGAVWAEPDVSHAASTMAEIAAGGEEVRRRVAAAQERVQALYSPAAAGRRLRGELKRLSAREVVE